MNELEQKREPKRHYSIENYRASTPHREWVEPTQNETKQIEIKQRHDAVMARLHKEARQWQRVRHVMLIVYGFVAAGMLIRETCKSWLHRHFPGVEDLLPLVSFGAQLVGLCTIYFRGQVAKEMASSADKRDIGAIVEALQVNRPVSQGALVRLLPELRASDGGLLQIQHRSILRYIMAALVPQRSRAPLIIAILKAYEQVGDEDDIPIVEKLGVGGGYGKYKNVRQAAEECLPALRIVASQHRQRATLLRASSANSSNPADLVRAVETKSEEDSSEMLRAIAVGAGP